MIDYVGDPYSDANFSYIWLSGEFSANRWNITSLWLFVVFLFSSNRLATKRVNGSARIMAQNAWNQARMCLLGVSSKNGHPHQPPNSENFALQKPFFVQNTDKSWRKCHQKSYSNRKQPMGISNLGLKIWPEVEFWPFLCMRSRKLAKTTWNRGPISKISRKSGTEKSNLRSNFTTEVVLWLFLRMRTKWPKWLKARLKLRLCTNPGAENLILYNINARRTMGGRFGAYVIAN